MYIKYDIPTTFGFVFHWGHGVCSGGEGEETRGGLGAPNAI